jgi:ribosome-binding protein aMBF1 (putative translation factor)
MLTSELSGLCCESIDGDDLEVEIDGDDLEVETDQVHTPLKVRTKGRLPYKRKESAVEKAINKKKSQEKSNELRQRKVAYFSSPSACLLKRFVHLLTFFMFYLQHKTFT